MKSALLAIWLAAAATAAARAETFSFISTGQFVSQVGGPPVAGAPASAAFSTATGQTTWASGKTSTTTSSCVAWTSAPGSGFSSTGVCDYTDLTGDQARFAFNCRATKADSSEGDCWGALSGLVGPRAGKSGTMSFHIWGFNSHGASRIVGAGVWAD